MLTEIERYLHEKIPLTRAMGVRVMERNDTRLVLEAPLELNHNHLGTAFGGSLSALAVLAGYGVLWLELREALAHVVIQESSTRFLRPVYGRLRAVCQVPNAAELKQFRQRFTRKGRARIDLTVTVEEAGKVAVEFHGTYVAVQPEKTHGK